MATHQFALTIADWNKRLGLRVLLSLSVVLIFILSLASLLAGAQEKQASPSLREAPAKVLILPPEVVFENFGGDSFRSALTNAANINLSMRKYTVITPDNLQDSNAIEWLKQLQPLSSRLARGAINDEAKQIFNHLATLPEEYLIFVQYMIVRTHPSGEFSDSSSGVTLMSSMSSTLLQAALISTRTGQIVWKNEVLKWELYPGANSPKFSKSLHHLYSTLGTKGGR
jgi:hypothetical protein